MQFICSTVIIGLVALCLESDARQEQLFASWQDAQRAIKSLVVHFTLETRDGSYCEKAEGTFRIIRTLNGEIFGSYQLTYPEGSLFPGQWDALLSNGRIYLLYERQKRAMYRGPTDGDLQRFLEKNFNPFVLLLDEKYAKEKCFLEVVKQDEWYTYLKVTPKNLNRYGWCPDQFHEGRVVLMNKSTAGVPKDMPRQLWYTNGCSNFIFEIKSWRFNAPDGPKAEEFAKPEDRPGWRVFGQ